MLTSITPLGERGRGQRYAVTMTAYVLGSLLGGLTTGAVLGGVGALLGRLVDGPVLVAAGLVLVLAAVLDLAAERGRRLPGGRRQVDEDWLTRYRGWVYGFGFGYQLGLGVVTVVTSAATYAVLALALLTASPLLGALVGAVFGLARCLPALVLGRARGHGELRATAASLERTAPQFRRLVVVALGVVGVTLVASSLG